MHIYVCVCVEYETMLAQAQVSKILLSGRLEGGADCNGQISQRQFAYKSEKKRVAGDGEKRIV